MAAIPEKIQTWQMIQPTTFDKETKQVTPGKLEKVEHPVPDLKPGEALVEVAGCGGGRMNPESSTGSRPLSTDSPQRQANFSCR